MACFGVLFFAAVLFAEDYNGTVKTIAKDETTVTVRDGIVVPTYNITITVAGVEKTFDFSEAPLIVDDKGKAIPGGLPNVKPGTEVKLHTEKKGDKDVVTTLKVLAPPDPNFKPPANTKAGGPGEYKGTLRSVSAEKMKVSLHVDNKDKVLDLGKNVSVADANGKTVKGGLAGVKAGSEVTAVTEKKGDKEVVTKLTVTGPPKK
jgi:hypothetical protein